MLIVLPLVGLFVVRLGDAVSLRAILVTAAAGWAIAVALAFLGVRLFDRERILTRLIQ